MLFVYADKSRATPSSFTIHDRPTFLFASSVRGRGGVVDLLGHRVRTAFYECLQRQRGLSKEGVPEHLEEFQRFLHETFGKGGETLTRCIMKRFSEKLGWSYVDMHQYDLGDYCALAERVTKSANEIIMTA